MEAIINSQLIDQYVATLDSTAQQARFRASVSQLQALSTQDADLSTLLTSFAGLVADLFAASAVAVWFAAPDSSASGATRKVAVGWSNLKLDDASEKAHDQLIALALQHRTPLAVLPFSAPMIGASASNPTDSFLLLGPARFGNRGVAVFEIALGPKPLRVPHEELLASYLRWLTWLTQILQRILEAAFDVADQPLLLAMGRLRQAANEVEEIQQQIRLTFQSALQNLAGMNFGSHADNQAVAAQVHQMLDGKGLRVQCPECGTAAILRCQKAGNSKTGAFTFDHYLDSGRTFHGGSSTFPSLVVVAKPPRRKSTADGA